MYKEVIIPKSAKYNIDIPKEYVNKKITIVLDERSSLTKSGRRSERNPRKGWAKLFKQMHENGDDKILIPDSISIDVKDWEW